MIPPVRALSFVHKDLVGEQKLRANIDIFTKGVVEPVSEQTIAFFEHEPAFPFVIIPYCVAFCLLAPSILHTHKHHPSQFTRIYYMASY